MSVPPDRMVPRNAGPIKDPNKIMGLSKPVFFIVVALGIVLAYIIYKRSQNSSAAPATTDSNAGLTAADIGGIPADNQFATENDATSLEGQIQALEASLAAAQALNDGSGVLPTTPGNSIIDGPAQIINPNDPTSVITQPIMSPPSQGNPGTGYGSTPSSPTPQAPIGPHQPIAY